jgi:hypothetical protein
MLVEVFREFSVMGIAQMMANFNISHKVWVYKNLKLITANKDEMQEKVI